MAHCMFSDESHGATDGYWCQLMDDHVEDHECCNSQYGYEYCPYAGNVDILSEKLCGEILSKMSEAIQEAAVEMNWLISEIGMAIDNTGYELLYEAWGNAGNYAPDFSGISGGYEEAIQYSLEKENAARLENSISEMLYSLNIPSSAYGNRPSGNDLRVSGDDLNRINDLAARQSENICYCLYDVDFGSESRYCQIAQEHLQKVYEEMYYFLISGLCAELRSVQEMFNKGMAATVQAAQDSGNAYFGDGVHWRFI